MRGGEVAVVRLGEEGVLLRRRVDAADQAGDVEGVLEGAEREAVAAPVLHRLQPGLEVEAERGRGRQRLQQRGLADAARPEDHRGGLQVRLGQPLVGGDDPERHQRASPSTRRKVGLPGFTVRAASKPSRIAAGQARVLPLRDSEGRLDVLGRIVAGGADARDHARRARLVPLDLLRQVGDHRDLVVVEADGAGVLALGAAGGRGTVAVAERDGAVQPVGERARGLRGLLGLLLQQRRARPRAARRSRRSAWFGCPRAGDGWRGVHYAASSVMVSDAKSGSAPSRRGRAMAK